MYTETRGSWQFNQRRFYIRDFVFTPRDGERRSLSFVSLEIPRRRSLESRSFSRGQSGLSPMRIGGRLAHRTFAAQSRSSSQENRRRTGHRNIGSSSNHCNSSSCTKWGPLRGKLAKRAWNTSAISCKKSCDLSLVNPTFPFSKRSHFREVSSRK